MEGSARRGAIVACGFLGFDARMLGGRSSTTRRKNRGQTKTERQTSIEISSGRGLMDACAVGAGENLPHIGGMRDEGRFTVLFFIRGKDIFMSFMG